VENEVEAVVRMGGSLRGGKESLRKNEIDKRGKRREIIKKKIERKRERTFLTEVHRAETPQHKCRRW